ncbi:MAG: rod shape-determining protein MreD [Bacteroidales bacterium]
MIRDLFFDAIRFVVLIILQILALNHIQFSGFVNPYPYILFILLLPFQIHPSFLLLLSAAMGLCIDIFSLTPGMHTSAAVFLGFTRPYILQFLAPHDGYEGLRFPGIRSLGFRWFLRYALMATFLHHLVLFFVEAFEFFNFFHTLFRILLSTLFTVLIVILAEYLISGSKRN